LCCTLNGETFIISTDPEAVYAFLGLDAAKLLQTHTRQELFSMVAHSWLYDPDQMVELRKTNTKEKDLDRPVMVDFLEFCKTHPRTSPIVSKTLQDTLDHFGKAGEYVALGLKQQEETRQKTLRSKTRDLLMTEFKKNGIVGKELGEKMNAFKEWVQVTFSMDYDSWSISADLDVAAVFNRFQTK
jgi:hypothetical protein